MEPHGPHVVGENEALQQFFSGHDVSRVLDSHTAAAVDTSILEQYLSADLNADLSVNLSADLRTNFILPESPPDSGSEAFSPAQMPERQYEPSLWRQQMFAPVSSSCRFKAPSAPPSELLTHEQLRNMGLTNIHIKPGSPPCAPAQRHLHTAQTAGHSPFLNLRGSAAPTPPPPPFRYTLCSEAGAHLHNAAGDSTTHSSSYSTLCSEQGAHLHNAAEASTSTLHRSRYNTLCSEAEAHLHNAAEDSTMHSGSYNTLCSEAEARFHNAAGASTSTAHSGRYNSLCSEQGTHLHNAAEDSAMHSGSYNTLCSEPETRLHAAEDSTSTAHSCSPESRKRRRSDFEESPRPKSSCEVGGPSVGGAGGFSGGSYSSLAWNQFSPDQWVALLDGSCQSLSPLAFHVDADKGFTFSSVDEAFVCQKKNHFQVTVQIGVSGEPRYVRTPGGSQEVDHFEIKVFGIKLEDRSHQVLIEQSQSDRSKRPFHPVRVRLPSCKITKVTLGRLHFSETTSNNIRKKGKPNPDQRYFQMVVGLYAAVKEETFLLTALVSERIIVRASNPGQFEADGEPLWQRGQLQDTAVCHGRVGINTDSPDEALVVCGNAKVMGTILQPSDQRAKHNLQEVDSEQQLKRITQMRIVEFDYKPEFAASMGIDQAHQTGVIAQEVKELLPSAVREVGDVTCSDGEKIHNFLMVDKEQIFMENIGAVQQLSKVTNNLETRIEELEGWNQRLAKLKSLTGSLRSHRKSSSACSAPTSAPSRPPKTKKEEKSHKHTPYLRRRIVQAGVFALLTAVAFCMISITAVYLVTLEEDTDASHEHSNSSLVPPLSTAWSSTVPPTTPPESWPPDVDFCDLLYCDQVYCCPSPPGGSTGINISLSDSWQHQYNLTEKRIQHFYNLLKNAKDWTNTSIQHFRIKENKQIIDSKYCVRDECGPSRFVFRVPISQFVPGNMRITLLMNSTELLVVHLCHFDESAACSTRTDMNTVTGSRYPTNTQGEHEWPLHVARLYHSSYHFRSSVAGQADCSTDHHYAGILFTDYHFHFYRRCHH